MDTCIRHGRIRGTVTILTVWLNSQLVAIWPLEIHRKALIKVAEPIGGNVPLFLGLLIDLDHVSSISNIVSFCLNNVLFDGFYTADLSTNDYPTKRLYDGFAKNGYASFSSIRTQSFYAHLSCTYDNYLQRTKSAKRRNKLRNEENKLKAAHSVNITRFEGGDIDDIVVNRIVAIQSESWMRRRGALDLHTQFNRDLITSMAGAGMCKVWIMKIDGEDAAFVLAYVHQGDFHYYRTAFKLKYAGAFSVGKILTLNVIREACEQGVRCFDFGHGDAEYKRFWSTGVHTIMRVALGRGAIGRLYVLCVSLKMKIQRLSIIRTLYRFFRKHIGSGH